MSDRFTEADIQKAKNAIRKGKAKLKKKARDRYDNRLEDLPRGLQIDTTTSAYGDSAKGRPVPKMKEGGYCRGAGAAIKGTKFEGVF